MSCIGEARGWDKEEARLWVLWGCEPDPEKRATLQMRIDTAREMAEISWDDAKKEALADEASDRR